MGNWVIVAFFQHCYLYYCIFLLGVSEQELGILERTNSMHLIQRELSFWPIQKRFVEYPDGKVYFFIFEMYIRCLINWFIYFVILYDRCSLFFWYICCQLYKAALGNCFEAEEWGPIEFCIMAKHFERQGKSPYAYHAVSYMMFLTVFGIFADLNWLVFLIFVSGIEGSLPLR